MKDLIKALREPQACPKCYAVHSREMPGYVDIKKNFPSHLRAVCWAYLCEACAEIIIPTMQAPVLAEVERLKTKLEEYGRHDEGCAALMAVGPVLQKSGKPCTCGLEEAASEDKKTEDSPVPPPQG